MKYVNGDGVPSAGPLTQSRHYLLTCPEDLEGSIAKGSSIFIDVALIVRIKSLTSLRIQTPSNQSLGLNWLLPPRVSFPWSLRPGAWDLHH